MILQLSVERVVQSRAANEIITNNSAVDEKIIMHQRSVFFRSMRPEFLES